MKHLIFLLAAIAIFATTGCCTTKNQSSAGTSAKGSEMLMDSSYMDDKDVTLVHKNEKIRIEESMKNFEENPNITLADLEAIQRIQSKEVQFLNKGDRIKISEEAPVK